MDGLELLKSWPDFANAGAATLMDQPSWRMTVDLGDRQATVLRRKSATPDDEIWLDIELSGESHTFGIGDSSAYPDLHLLWSRRQALPPAILLALIEKECGTLFQSVEAVTHKILSVKGLAAKTPTDELICLTLSVDGGDYPFSLIRCRRFELALGQLRNLDLTHPDLRGRKRSMTSEYARFPSGAIRLETVVPGVSLLFPEDSAPCWCVPDSSNDYWSVCGIEKRDVAFGEFLDDALPDFPAPERLKLMYGGRAYAIGDVVSCGDVRVFRIRELVRVGQVV